ncbi:hypothetical protein THAOC_04101 [Thalassiosira oceanica]|uniref:Uncharacterized protein n=1 Tax=Thalassiosira oceanica TaxID=159749 RepID=K0TP75_THAOC|nr:hypothetical protein THAOC_04101 [Thalassiosira oceanica]|eukprot:EJK74232.1 hypothetical protein THAOC_04101 [Thalassiosira oceanica]
MSQQPQWTDTAAARPAVVEDHTGSSSSPAPSGADELLEPYSTLDEPVRETIMRDVRAVGVKLRAVMMPLDRRVSHRASRTAHSKPFGYMGVLQEDNVEPSDEQRNVLNQLRDWDLW